MTRETHCLNLRDCSTVINSFTLYRENRLVAARTVYLTITIKSQMTNYANVLDNLELIVPFY